MFPKLGEKIILKKIMIISGHTNIAYKTIAFGVNFNEE